MTLKTRVKSVGFLGIKLSKGVQCEFDVRLRLKAFGGILEFYNVEYKRSTNNFLGNQYDGLEMMILDIRLRGE